MTYYPDTHTCRLCKKSDTRLIKYGTRHYAHSDCALSRWGADFFTDLQLWQLENFPALVADSFGLLPQLIAAANAKRESIAKLDAKFAASNHAGAK